MVALTLVPKPEPEEDTPRKPVVRFRSITARLVSVVGDNVPGPRWHAYQKAIAGLRYYREHRKYLTSIEQLPTLLTRLRDAEFDVDLEESVREGLQQFSADQWTERKAAEERIERIDEEIWEETKKDRLFTYQKSGALFLVRRKRAALFDDMGTGKSLTTLVALPPGAPILVVCPVIAKGTWETEVRRRPQIRPTVLYGKGSFRWPTAGEMVITSFAILPEIHDTTNLKKGQTCRGRAPRVKCPGCKKQFVVDIEKGYAGEKIVPDKHGKKCNGFTEPPPCFGCLRSLLDSAPSECVYIVDEAQAAKNPKAEQTKRMRALSTAVQNKNGRAWILTGTPLENEPVELWNVLELAGLAEEAFDNFDTFKKLFGAKLKANGFGLDWGLPTDEVVERLQRVSLRRDKASVMPDLPEKMYQTVLVEIDDKTKRMCDRLTSALGMETIVSMLEKGDEGLSIGEFSRVRAALAIAKIPSMLEYVKEMEENGEPLVVFSAHRAPIDVLSSRAGWVVVTGDEDAIEKKKNAFAFQSGKDEHGNKIVGIGLTIRAGGVSLTLTRANRALFIDRDPNPAKDLQAEDRIHRLTQKRGCMIVDLFARHPMDERIGEILRHKTRLITATVDASSMKDDAPLPESIKLLLAPIADEIETEAARFDSDSERATYDALHSRSWESRATHRLAMDLAEEATSVGLTVSQWGLAKALVALSIDPETKEVVATETDEGEEVMPKKQSKGTKTEAPNVRTLEHTWKSVLRQADGLSNKDKIDLVRGLLNKMDDDSREELFHLIFTDYCEFGLRKPCDCDHDEEDEDDEDAEDGEYDEDDKDEDDDDEKTPDGEYEEEGTS